jgi:superfamily II DNA or RNA helicase
VSNDILTPRPYQKECINAVAAAKFRGVQRPVVVLPTGAGKTIVFAHLSKLFREAFPVKKVVILAHTDELVQQAARKIKAVAPHLKVGVVMADRHEIWADVIVASVQSLRSDRRLADVCGVGLIVVDECHHATAESYRKILRHYGALPAIDEDQRSNGPGDVFVVGFTATLKRSDRRALNEVWQEVVFTRDIAFMIEQNFLVRPRGISIEVPDLKLSEVRRQGGDYQQKALASAVVKSMAPEIVAQKYVEHAADRPGILFWPSVETAYLGAQSMISAGISCEVIEGSMPREERRLALKKAETGEVQTLSSCMVLTEGFDNPRMSCAVIARPTDSAPLYQQMVGRVLRPHAESGKTDALVLDVVGAGKQHTLEALIDLEDKTKKTERDEDEELDDDGLPRGGGMGPEDVIPYSGETVVLEFDPLAKSSKRVWLTTTGAQARFLRAGLEHYVFLAPGVVEGNWTVAWCRKVPRIGYGATAADNAGITEHAELPLDIAMRWAEQIVTENFGDGEAHKDAIYRTREASIGLIARARKMKLKSPLRGGYFRQGSHTIGEIEDLIEQKQASDRIDPIIRSLNPIPE